MSSSSSSTTGSTETYATHVAPMPPGGAKSAAEISLQPSLMPQAPPIDRRYVTAALMLVMMLASMEQTITSTAMYTIVSDLHGLEHYAWVTSIYLLCSTVTMPLYGRLADALGRKRVIQAAICIFIGSSVLASFSHTMIQLVIFRGLQGLGAGGIMPLVLTILGDMFTIEQRARIQGLFSAIWGGSALAGPALGAFLVKTLGWRSIFFVNLPLGLLAVAVLTWKYHEHVRAKDPGERRGIAYLDLPGIATISIACFALLALVSGLGPGGWSWPSLAAFGAVTVIAFAMFARREKIASNPVVPPGLLMRRNIGPSLVASGLLGVAFISLDTYVPLYVQGGRGGHVTEAAWVVTPVMLTWAISAFLGAPLLVRWGFRKTGVIGSLFSVAGFAGLLIGAATNAPHWVLTTSLAVSGLGFGPTSLCYLLAAQDAVEWHQRGVVTSGVTFFRTIGGALGIGLFQALFNVLFTPTLHSFAAQGVTAADVTDPRRFSLLPHDVATSLQGAIVHALIWIFVGMLIMTIAQTIVTSLLPKHRKPDHAVKPHEVLEGAGV